MNLRCEVAVVGAGLAGACAALHLSRQRDVILFDAEEVAAGASGAGAGLVNPLTGRRAVPVWHMREALNAFEEAVSLANAADIYLGQGVIRPAMGAAQAGRFRKSAEANPDIAQWLEPDAIAERYPLVAAPNGGLHVVRGGAVPIERMCYRLIEAASKQGARVLLGRRLTQFEEKDGRVRAELASPDGAERLEAESLVVAPGPGYYNLPRLRDLDLHRIKGQTVRVKMPQGIPPDHPHVSGLGYVVNEGQVPGGEAGASSLLLGSTYEHEFNGEAPDQRATAEILTKTRKMMGTIGKAEVVEAKAGIRVTVPKVRLPMAGPVPGFDCVWFIGGLGSKGLLMAPMIGRHLIHWMASPEHIPEPLRPRWAWDS